MPLDVAGSTPSHTVGHEALVRRPPPPAPQPGDPDSPSYYDIPFLKRPVWSWEIGCYFFLGGLSAGSYILARVAERAGGDRFRALTRTGTAIAAAAVVPCPALLIADLGDPKRFHHMLRVFKPHSPMNLGSWVLTGYSGVVFLTAVREWLRGRADRPSGIIERVGLLLLDAAGLPLALFFSGYTGVLISGTSTPVWSKNPWLGPLFTASAISNSASAISLVLELRSDAGHTVAGREALQKIDEAAHVAEVVTLAGYLATAGDLAKPLTHGRAAPYFWGAVGGLVASELLRHAPAGKTTRRWARVAGAALEVASGFLLKWGMHHAGPPSASDPEADRQISRRRTFAATPERTGSFPR